MLYAVVANSMADFSDIAKPVLRKRGLKLVAVGMNKDFAEGDCYAVMGYAALKKHHKRFHNKKVAVVVFDTPPRVMDLKPDRWLDAKEPTLSYRFTFLPMDRRMINSMAKRLENGKEGEFNSEIRKMDVLPALLNAVDLEGIINRFNDLIMHGVARVDRDMMKKRILQVVYGYKTIAWLEKQFPETRSKSTRDLRAKFIESLSSKEGQVLCRAVQASEKGGVEKAAEKFKVDPKSIRYLSKAKASLKKIGLWDKK